METRTRSLCAERWGRRIPTECLHAQAARTETRRNKAQDAGDSTQLSRFPVSFVCAVSGMPGGTRARPPPAPRCPRPHQLLRIRCAGTRMRRVHIASAVSNFRCITVKSCCWPRVGARLACPGPSVPERYGESCMPRQLQPGFSTLLLTLTGPVVRGPFFFFFRRKMSGTLKSRQKLHFCGSNVYATCEALRERVVCLVNETHF